MLPLGAAFGIRRLAVAKKGEQWFHDRLLPRIQSTQIAFVGLAIVAMFTSKGAELIGEFGVFLRLLPPIRVFFGLNLVLAFVPRRIFRIELPVLGAVTQLLLRTRSDESSSST